MRSLMMQLGTLPLHARAAGAGLRGRLPAMGRRLLPLVALVLVACGRTEPLTAEELASYQHCAIDDDCVLSTNGCGCAVEAVATSREEEFADLFSCDSDERPQCAPENSMAKCQAGRCAAIQRP